MNEKMLLQFMISVCLIIGIAMSQKMCCNERWYSYDILPDNYNSDSAPKLNGKPVQVDLALVVLLLLPDPQTVMSFNVDLFYYLYWNDYRLLTVANDSSQNLTLGYKWKEKLWIPEIYFRNAMSAGISRDITPNIYFTITNGTQISMAARLELKLFCNMNFRKYPFDTQTCFINITSLSQKMDSVQLNWQSFRVLNDVDAPEFDIKEVLPGVCNKDYDILGSYSCLYVIIHLNRNFGNYLIKRFVPSFLIVVMTFVGFWIPTSIAPARVTLIITSLVALVAQQIQLELNISYVYALQVWTVICIFFVFATLLEYGFAITCPFDEKASNQENSVHSENDAFKKFFTFIKVKAGPRNCPVDIVSRILFPSLFGLTVFIYSLVYCFE